MKPFYKLSKEEQRKEINKGWTGWTFWGEKSFHGCTVPSRCPICSPDKVKLVVV